jgi:autotransporter-associated beta strand protein
MFLGALGNDSYSASLAAGSGATYRLGGGGGTLTLPNANTLTGANSLIVGAAALNGTVVIGAANDFSGSTTLVAGTLAVGNNSALSAGTLNLNGGTIRADGGPITLSNPLTLGGNFTITGSENLALNGIATLTGNRTITITGPGLATLGGSIGENAAGRSLTKAGTGTLVLSGSNSYSGGTTVGAGTLQIAGANQALGLGNVSVSSGAILRQAAFSNLAGGATVNVNSGGVLGLDGNFPPTLAAASAGTVAINIATYSQTLNQSTMGNGQMFIGSQGSGQYNSATLGAGASNTYRLGGAGGTLTIPNANVVTGFNGLIVGSTQINGAGTVVVGASQDYQGNTTINANSTLNLQAGLSGPGTVSVLANGTLAGTGPVAGLVNANGRVSPGASPGVLTIIGGLTMAAGSRYVWELAALTTGGSGTNWDRIDIGGGTLNVASAAVLAPQFIGTATPPNSGDPFWQTNHTWNNVIALTGGSGTGSLIFQIDNSAWSAFGGFDTRPATFGMGVELRWTPVPEPVHLLGLAGLATVLWRVRRRSQMTS